MWSVDENYRITMTKGDTPSFKVECNIVTEDGETQSYVPEEGDEFVFACKQDKDDKVPLLTIKIPSDTMILSFKEEDTKFLELGRYIWEISLNKPSGYHCTFITNKTLVLTVEVY